MLSHKTEESSGLNHTKLKVNELGFFSQGVTASSHQNVFYHEGKSQHRKNLLEKRRDDTDVKLIQIKEKAE